MAPLELMTPHLASSWHPKAPRLGDTNWLYIRRPLTIPRARTEREIPLPGSVERLPYAELGGSSPSLPTTISTLCHPTLRVKSQRNPHYLGQKPPGIAPTVMSARISSCWLVCAAMS